ncbi:DUF4175 family protein [Planctomyces sp. SH-PL62]|uniref:DUF4175 family protein n=1 Tax=Planctomyces sp. SH-PL62 TaxID=1636152 RepID=UPI00078D56A2|nr:DUF4175 family protein [Planctomyces sp. SH-PL62]AMV37323.1 hypothetical protein VT85_07810 [Planctomyces sp. SH-PL62]
MSRPRTRLETRLASFRNRIRRLLLAYGASRVAAAAIPLILAACLADWAFHLDPLVRLAALVAIVAAVGWSAWLRVVRPALVPFQDLDAAMRIEKRWPGLEDRLASTVQFLRTPADDPSFGSPALREATIRKAEEEVESLDFREVVDARPMVRAATLAAAAALLAASAVVLDPASAGIAARRLFVPFGGDRWPQRTHLALDPAGTTLKLAKGDAFSLVVRVREGDRVPDSVRAVYRYEDGETAAEPLAVVEGGEFRGRIETVDRPFTFSVSGGDDSSSIRDVAVRVVPPPALTRTTVRLTPPTYTGQPAQVLASGLTSFKVLKGTRVEVEAAADKPLSSATVHRSDGVEPTPARLDAVATGFSTSFTPEADLTFWFALADAEGFTSREAVRYDVRLVKDEAPRVAIVEPKTDRDVPPDALVPVAIDVDDDYGIHSARMLYQIASGDSEPHDAVALPLWSAPPPEAAEASVGPGSAGTAAPSAAALIKHQSIRHDWDLGPLALPPGAIVTFHADARDFDAISGPNRGKSRELRLRIVAKEEAARQFDEARRALREEIARTLAMQKQAAAPVADAARALDQAEALTKPQRDDLDNAGLVQRQVAGRLDDREDGLERNLRRLLDDLQNFKLDNAPAKEQMEHMLAQIVQMREKNLGAAEQALNRARKNLDAARDQAPAGPQNQPAQPNEAVADQPGENQPAGQADAEAAKAQPGEAGEDQQAADRGAKEAAKEALAQARENQGAVADELQKMLDELGEFETYRGVVKDAQDLLKKQEQAIKQSADAAARPELAGKDQAELTPEQKADLANQATRQQELAGGLQDLQEKMDQMAARLDQTDPLAASALREAAQASRDAQTAAKMEEAARGVEKNQMGQARAGQEAAKQDLKELVDLVQNRRERELARLVKELKKAETDLRALRARQAENLKATREAKNIADAQKRKDELQKLGKEQAQIQEELKKQLQKLAKLNADAAAKAGGRASSRMSKAQEQMDADDAEQAGGEEEEALADLNDAQDELEQTRRDAEEKLADEQLARMGDQLKSLSERQTKLVGDAEGFDKIRHDAGDLTRGQRVGVRNLGQIQSGLKEETGDLVKRLDGAPVFALTLRRASDDMDSAAAGLAAIKTDQETLDAARAAAKRFEQLMDALKRDDGKNGGQGAAREAEEAAAGEATASPPRPRSR